MDLIVAEKPSVARDIARVLGITTRGTGELRGPRHVVTWCLGHLVELEEPASYNPAWRRWSLEALPMLPERFKLRPVRSSAGQWKIVRGLLRDRSFHEVINACDAGREGELIFRLCYELAGSRLPVKRLWVSSMTDTALKAGLAALRPSERYDPLADAARCRSEADWLVGMNSTRAVTTRNRGTDGSLYSIGRVQTPTLALVVRREQAIRAFVPTDYWEVYGSFRTEGVPQGFRARWCFGRRSRLATGEVSDTIVRRMRSHPAPPTGARVENVDTRPQRVAPPLLFDLTSLQRTANRRWGLSAQRTLDVAQALYETHKLLTYPRTDSRYLTGDVRGELPEIFDALASVPAYAPFARHLRIHPPGATPRVFNDARVSDHHAIIPTVRRPDAHRLDRDEARIHDLVVRRFLGAFMADAEFLITTVVVVVGPAETPPPADLIAAGETRDAKDADELFAEVPPPPDRFIARGRTRMIAGWQEVAGVSGAEPDTEAAELQDLPPLTAGLALTGNYESVRKQTQAPRRYSEATLLAAMESAGRDIDDDTLRAAMKDTGLGTPATRAATIETLLRRNYILREQKNLLPTAQGEGLISGLPVPSLASAELTGQWEARLARMARGQELRTDFMRDIVAYVREVVDGVRAAPPSVTAAVDAAAAHGSRPATPHERPREAPAGFTCPRCKVGTIVTGRHAWGCSRWREGCTLVIPFEVDGRRVTIPQLRSLIAQGVTRVSTWSHSGTRVSARLRLDVKTDPPSVVWEPAEIAARSSTRPPSARPRRRKAAPRRR